MNDFLTLADVAALLRVSKPTVRKAKARRLIAESFNRATVPQVADLLKSWTAAPGVRKELGPTIDRVVTAYVAGVDERFAVYNKLKKYPRELGSVYLLSIPGRDLVKVGTSTDVVGHFLALQGVVPDNLEFLDVLPGGRYLELALHRCLRGTRVRSEWFRHSSALCALLELASAAPSTWDAEPRARVA